MKSRITVITFFLLFAAPVFSFAQEKNQPDVNMSAYEHANENAKFNRTRTLFYSKRQKDIRAKKAKRLAEEKAAEEKKKAEEAQDKGEGQFKIKF